MDLDNIMKLKDLVTLCDGVYSTDVSSGFEIGRASERKRAKTIRSSKLHYLFSKTKLSFRGTCKTNRFKGTLIWLF